ncbi:MarR family winged helix-turn-helix transcriptional regulator [Prauserella halophila]|uniref:MarR family winged helix-turn-helix transcriptional regulator n=1 Tax=Prauserella halophila TaxID=185641 RepID=A0ABN1VUS0_9PSEU|nr:MarR family winged helix-turn-helix transcriptional regulator [Prauserella halophila]MCP2234461.1 DNA-binding transcriptional regulator, MarR family [Prauserella halophila]
MTAHDPGPGQVLFHFVRHWSRRSVAGETGGEQGRLVLVCDAVDALGRRGVSATINAIAHEVGIDQSGASRLVTNATVVGHLDMAVAAVDGRRREARLTPSGRAMLEQAHHWQEEVFARLTAGWSDRRRRDFRQAMTDLMERSYLMDAEP